MSQVRWIYGMTLVDDGNVLMCGGYNNGTYFSKCLLYNAAVNGWSTIPSLPLAIAGFPMITLHGRPFVCGGSNDSRILSSTVYTFDTSGVWSARASMPVGLLWHNAVANDTLDTALVCGGQTELDDSSVQSACYTYSFTANAWTPAASLNTARASHGMAVYKGAKKNFFHLIVCVLWVKSLTIFSSLRLLTKESVA